MLLGARPLSRLASARQAGSTFSFAGMLPVRVVLVATRRTFIPQPAWEAASSELGCPCSVIPKLSSRHGLLVCQ